MNISLISNVIFEPYIKNCLCNSFLHIKTDIEFTNIPYEEFEERSREIEGSDIIVVSLNFDALYPDYVYNICSKTFTTDEIINDCTRKCFELHSFVKKYSKLQMNLRKYS